MRVCFASAERREPGVLRAGDSRARAPQVSARLPLGTVLRRDWRDAVLDLGVRELTSFLSTYSGKVPPPEAVRPVLPLSPRSSLVCFANHPVALHALPRTNLTLPLGRAQASALYETIEAAESIDESGLPQQAYVVPEGTVGATAPLSTAGQAPAQGGQGGQKIFDATGA